MKRGFLDILVLAAIKHKDSYGYLIIKDLKPYFEISESTLYPILKRLEASELLTVRSEEYNGRLRKYYRITQLGTQRLATFADEWQEMMQIYDYVTRGDDNGD